MQEKLISTKVKIIILFITNRGQKILEWVPKKQFHEAGNFKALRGFLLITVPVGFKKNSQETVAKWNSYTCHPADTPTESIIEHTQISECTQEGGRLPDVLPFLQNWQTDGAFFFRVFVCPLVFILLTMQLSLCARNIWKRDLWFAGSLG